MTKNGPEPLPQNPKEALEVYIRELERDYYLGTE
jgi:hypothetical protein